jgi:hypothetical protein
MAAPLRLGPEHVSELLDLQDRVIDRYGSDRIWVHDRQGLETLFAAADEFLAFGVRGQDGLVAASLSRLMSPAEVSPLTPGLSWTRQDAAHIGLNTLSLPGSGAPQMIRLLRARRDHLLTLGVRHLFGGISPEHPVSLGCAFRAGAVGVGHLVADGAVELLLWFGPGLEGARLTPAQDRAAARDLARQAALMRQGLVATGLGGPDRSELLFAPIPFLKETTWVG